MLKNKLPLLCVLSILFISLVVSSTNVETKDSSIGISDKGIKYDFEILNKFNENNSESSFILRNSGEANLVSHWVHVTVDILDISNITIPNRNSPDFEQTLQKRNTIMIEQTDAVLSTLSEEEFQLKSKSEFGGSFSGNITKEGFDKLLNDERVRKIYAQKIGSVDLIKSAPLIGANYSWNLGYAGEGQTVCVIDTGVNYTHPALGGCTEAEFLAGTCDKVPGGYDYYNGNSSPMDDGGHGTHVAGIIASTNSTYKGIANGAKIVALKACDSDGICDDHDAVTYSLQWCLNNAATYNISVVSMSLGWNNGFGACGEDFADEDIDNLYNAGIPVVVSSGNDADYEEISYPACNNETIAVGATYDDDYGYVEFPDVPCSDYPTDADKITCFTNRGSLLSLLAPGCFIKSANSTTGGFDYMCGTSQAAPMVSGAAALLLERNPNLTPADILDILHSTGKDVYDNETNLTFRRIDIAEAMSSFNFVIETTSTNQTFSFQTDDALNLRIHWGDGETDVYNGTGLRSHVYSNPGNYTVSVHGEEYQKATASRISFYEGTPTLLKDILTPVSDGVTGITSAQYMFRGCTGITSFTSSDFFDETSGDVTDFEAMFTDASNYNQDLENWNTSSVTDMKSMFVGANNFNGNISTWDTSSVTSMAWMFVYAYNFNQDIGNWDTSNVVDMWGMFNNAISFNQDIGSWDTSSVIYFEEMFWNADNFNQNLSNWDTSNVAYARSMFYGTNNFNGNIGTWDTSKIVNMQDFFRSASSFNQDISNWNTSSVTKMDHMFQGATSFNQDIGNWEVSQVTNMSNMFFWATNFNQNLNWDTSSVTDMSNMFARASNFNGNISSWDTGNVINMASMFSYAYNFNQDLNWDTSGVTDMNNMFYLAQEFNGNISTWDTSSIIDMSSMFSYAYDFNQDLNNWNVSNVVNMNGMFGHADSFNQDLNNWDTSSVTDMFGLFSDAGSFNGNISTWDTSSVIDMAAMFGEATNFNQDINNWDTSNVSDMWAMFALASNFNQDIGNWDVSNVRDMEWMFIYANNFNQDISNWNVSGVNNMSEMFYNVTLSTYNYDSLLNGWNSLPSLQTGVSFDGGNSQYSLVANSSRQSLIDIYSWSISDGGMDSTLPEVGIEVIYPTTDVNVPQNSFFNVTLNITCKYNNCGDISISLDPEEINLTENIENNFSNLIEEEIINESNFFDLTNESSESLNNAGLINNSGDNITNEKINDTLKIIAENNLSEENFSEEQDEEITKISAEENILNLSESVENKKIPQLNQEIQSKSIQDRPCINRLRSKDSTEEKLVKDKTLTKEFNSEDREIKISNSNESLIDLKLISNYNELVPSGENVKVAEFELINWEEDKDLFDSIKTYDVKRGYSEVERDFILKYAVDSSKEECIDETNSTKTNCQTIVKTDWIKFDSLDELPNKNIWIGLFTNTKKGEKIEWVPTIRGFEILEFASWEVSLDADLVAYYDFNEVGGSNLPDVYDGNNNGSISGASWVEGKKGNALSFDGVNDYVNLPGYSSTLDERTWAFWVKPGPHTGADIIWYRGGTNWAIHHLNYENDNRFAYKIYYGADYWIYTDVVTDDNWYFVVITRNSTTRQIYLNGVLNDSDSHPGYSSSYNEWLGEHPYPTSYFNGSLDMSGSWNRVLTSDEIQTLYNEGSALQYQEGISSDLFCFFDASGNNCGGDLNLSGTDLCTYGYGMAYSYAVNNANITNASDIKDVTLTLWHTSCDNENITLYLNGNAIHTLTDTLDCSCTPAGYKWPETISLDESKLSAFVSNWNFDGNNVLSINKTYTYNTLYNSLSYLEITYEPSSKGLISTTVGDTPFYTNESNPKTISLGKDESQLVTFWINATGGIYSVNKFFAYANLTVDESLSNISDTWDVTINRPEEFAICGADCNLCNQPGSLLTDSCEDSSVANCGGDGTDGYFFTNDIWVNGSFTSGGKITIKAQLDSTYSGAYYVTGWQNGVKMNEFGCYDSTDNYSECDSGSYSSLDFADNRCNMTFGSGYWGSESANFGADSTINSSASIGDYHIRVSYSYYVDCSAAGAGGGYSETDGDFCEESDYGENDGINITLSD